jgi:ParB-like chromosome segregation protein Spo0J
MPKQYPFHPLCLLLPEPSTTEYADLKADILQNGLIDPIILLDEQILDGRSRYNCCKDAGIDPTYIQFTDAYPKSSPTAFVIAKNLKRRHLSTEQRGIAAGKLMSLESGAVSKEQAAKLLNVSEATVTRARKVIKDAIPEVQKEVEQGLIKMAQAERIANKPVEEQPEALVAEKAQVEELRKKAAESRKAIAATQSAVSQVEKSIATYTDCADLCKEGQYDGKKLRKAISQLQAAVDDLAIINMVVAEILEAGHAFHNLTVCIDVLVKHTGIPTDTLKKSQLARQHAYDASHQKLIAMKKFIDGFAAIAESLFSACSNSDEQDLLLSIQEKFAEHKTLFEEAVKQAVTVVKLQVLTSIEASPPEDWFSDVPATPQ